MSIRSIWIINLSSENVGEILFYRTFPTVEKRCKQLYGTDYIGLPIPSTFVNNLLIRLGITVSSKQFIEWRDKVNGCMQLPVIDVKIGDHEMWPVLSIFQQSLLVCCLPLIDILKPDKKESLLQMPSVSVGFSVMLGIVNFLGMKSFEKRKSQLMELDNFLTQSLPFGTPSDMELSYASFMNNVHTHQFTKRQPAWKPFNYKGKQHIHIKILEYVRCIQSDQSKSLYYYEIFGQILMLADLEGPLNDVTLSVMNSEKSCPLDSVILHPCVHMLGSTASASVSSLLRRLRFSPPLNEFVLLQYCSSALKELPIQGVFKMLGENSVELLIQLKLSENVRNLFEYCDVLIMFFNRGPVKKSEFSSSYGLPKLSDDKHSLVWNIGAKFPKELEVALTAKLEFHEKPILPNSDPFCRDKNCFAQVNFKQNNSTLSGCSIDPKSLVVSQTSKTKITIEKSVQSSEYRIWNSYGDLPFPADLENKFEKMLI